MTNDDYLGNFGMFTPEGDFLVEGIVLEAKKYNHSWNVVHNRL